MLDAKNLKKLGWRGIGVKMCKVILALFVVHGNPVILLGGMYLSMFLDFNFYFSYFLGLSAYGAWMMLQAFIFKRLHVDIKYFIKIKWRSIHAILVSLFPFACYFGLIVLHSFDSAFRKEGVIDVFLVFFVAIPSFVILSSLCFLYQTYCLVRSRKRLPPFFLGA